MDMNIAIVDTGNVDLAFKADTDDMCEAPALIVIDKLLKDSAAVRVFDPIAMEECWSRIGDGVMYYKVMYDTYDGAVSLRRLQSGVSTVCRLRISS